MYTLVASQTSTLWRPILIEVVNFLAILVSLTHFSLLYLT